MKRALLLLSLLSVPCVVTSCKDDAAPGTSITTETDTAAPSTGTASADAAAATVSPLDKLCKLLKLYGYSDAEIKIFRAGYEGDTVTLESLKDKKHIGIYCTGAAAAGNKELVLQCLDKGATDYNDGLQVAALGGHMDIVQLMLDKGATDLDKALQAAEDFGHTECAELIRAAMKK